MPNKHYTERLRARSAGVTAFLKNVSKFMHADFSEANNFL